MAIEMINQKKDKFLKKYNPTHSVSVAQSKSISAAVQHNKLYTEGLNSLVKKEIRKVWIKELISKAEKYVNIQSVQQFETDFISLQKTMNELFLDSFQSNHKGGNGFRISHSQKSLSVYLKHLWCMNVIALPPICPVDGIILKLTEARGANATWTYVNTLEEHRKRFCFIQQKADSSSLSVSEWEMLNFKP